MNDLYNLSTKSLNVAQLRFIAHKIDLYIFKIWYITHNNDEIEQKFDKCTRTILSVNKRHTQLKRKLKDEEAEIEVNVKR